MKLHTDRNEVERSGVASETTFRIKTTAKAFDILSSGLYTDRILAVVRELSCNAVDAHVAANKADMPFEIHLPNSLEPWFHVRDEGTGMSDEDVMNLYSTYFDSTKTCSNDFIGALGLGSKSPFSYTKAFEVISRHNGKRRMYSIFINEDGVPTIARLGEFETDEKNGLEVKITIKPEDFGSFAQKTSTALRWFPVKPRVIGYSNFKFAEIPTERSKGDTWKIFNAGFTNDYSKMTAVQGNVAYKVDISKLNFTKADEVLLNNGHIVGFFNIGELETAASREEIRYDDRSKVALMERVHSIRQEVMQQFIDKADNMKGENDWNVFIELEKMGAKVFGYASHLVEFLSIATHPMLKKYRIAQGQFKLDHPRGHTLVGYKIGRDGTPETSTMHRTRVASGTIHPEANFVFFLNDIKIGGISRVEHFLRTTASSKNEYKSGIVIRKVDLIYKDGAKPDASGKMNPDDLWENKDYDIELVKIMHQLGDIKVTNTSTLEAPPRDKREINLPAYQYECTNSHRYGPTTIAWKRVDEFDINEGGLYFDIRNGAVITLDTSKGVTKDCSWGAEQVMPYLKLAVNVINKANGTSYKIEDVYGFGAAAKKKAKKSQVWTNIFDLLVPLIKNCQDHASFISKLDSTDEGMGIKSILVRNSAPHVKTIKSGLKTLVDTSPFKMAFTQLIEDVENFKSVSSHSAYEMMKALDVDLESKILDSSTKDGYYKDNVFGQYPMLTFVDRFDYLKNDQIELFFDYIRTIDKAANRS